jgi:OFA family oxalate/formate antiporter-like MFS transporter
MNGEAHISRWWRVVGGLSMNLALGSVYAWSVFVAPLEKEFGWKRADTSMIFSIIVFVFALSFVLAGRLQDKKGPFWISIIGGVAVSIGFFVSSWTTTLGQMFFWLGIIAGIGNGFGYATPIPVMAKWFPDRRGLAVGLAVAGYGGGSAIFGPLAGNWLIPTYGWRVALQVLGVIFFVMTMIGAFLLRNPPAGYRPPGWAPAPAAKAAATAYDFAPSETLKTPTFYFMWIAYCLGTIAGFMAISQIVPYARNVGLGALGTTGIVVGAAGNAAGRILSGAMSDAMGRLNVLRLMIAISALAPVLLLWSGANAALFFLMMFAIYWGYGTQLSVNASTTSDFWGTKNAGLNYGLLFTSWGVAGLIGPRIAGTLFDKYQNYQAAFYTAAVLAVVALLAEFLAKRPTVPEGVPAKATA